ncbi:hypothetical protein [Marinobacter sp. SS13-12]|uniref:hypothetical protein n=1 Tax=Marinobacter sp. SS13-12 TaxID=3050451 RepID=UPI0025562333|nr:hypothetical protein [Marinobacter sp. SS13-12]MDK8464188.1 hypothetical protein [Marinobacter sp. SS13-12]
MATKKKPARSSQARSQVDVDVVIINDIVARQAGASDDFVAGRTLLKMTGLEAAAEEDPGALFAETAKQASGC